MMRTKLIEVVSQIKCESTLLKRNTVLQMCCTSKYNTSSKKNTAKKIEDKLDKPIQFSKTRAATAPAEHTMCRPRGTPWYQGLVVSASMAVFFIYFCILREENDIDQKIVEGVTPEMKEYLYGVKAQEQRRKMGRLP